MRVLFALFAGQVAELRFSSVDGADGPTSFRVEGRKHRQADFPSFGGRAGSPLQGLQKRDREVSIRQQRWNHAELLCCLDAVCSRTIVNRNGTLSEW